MPKHWIYWIHYRSDHILWFTPLYDRLPGAGPRRQDPQRIQGDSDHECRNPWILSQDAWSCLVGLDIQAKPRPNTSKKTDRQVYHQSPSVATAPRIFVESLGLLMLDLLLQVHQPRASSVSCNWSWGLLRWYDRRYISHARLSMCISVWLRTVSFICITAMW